MNKAFLPVYKKLAQRLVQNIYLEWTIIIFSLLWWVFERRRCCQRCFRRYDVKPWEANVLVSSCASLTRKFRALLYRGYLYYVFSLITGLCFDHAISYVRLWSPNQHDIFYLDRVLLPKYLILYSQRQIWHSIRHFCNINIVINRLYKISWMCWIYFM